MADIFISYAHADRALAASLARDLTSRGYSVWWDTELVGGDDFSEVILAALQRAKAAIVIWSKMSVKSRFVRDEARMALHLAKLIAVKTPDLDHYDIPLGFQGQHTDSVNNREQIFRAISKLRVRPLPASSSPSGDHIKSLEKKRIYEIGDLKRSNWQAFLDGVVLRVPKFQLSKQGAWTAIGIAAAYSAIPVTLVMALRSALLNENTEYISPYLAVLSSGIFAITALVLWSRMGAFLTQRNLVSAIILSFAFALQATASLKNLIEAVLSATLLMTFKTEDEIMLVVFLIVVFSNIAIRRVVAYR